MAGCGGHANGVVLGSPRLRRRTGALAGRRTTRLLRVRRQINVHGISTESCDRRHEVITAALDACRFRLHEVSRASQQHKQLGVRLDGVARVSRRDPPHFWRVHLALRCLLRMGGARLRVVRVLTGHLVTHLPVSTTLVVGTPSTVSLPGSSA